MRAAPSAWSRLVLLRYLGVAFAPGTMLPDLPYALTPAMLADALLAEFSRFPDPGGVMPMCERGAPPLPLGVGDGRADRAAAARPPYGGPDLACMVLSPLGVTRGGMRSFADEGDFYPGCPRWSGGDFAR